MVKNREFTWLPVSLGLVIALVMTGGFFLLVGMRGDSAILATLFASLAGGMYLPFTLAVPIFLGGLVRYLGQRGLSQEKAKEEIGNAGVLLSSGLIAGESILGLAAYLMKATGKIPD